MFKLILLCFLLGLAASEAPYNKIVHNTDPEAKCLDGSPPALYIHEGNQSDKMIIFIKGVGFCEGTSQSEVIQSCYQRSKTMLGSSNLWPAQIVGQGYLSTNPEINRFAGWTKIILAYCDGALHQGYRKEPIKYKNTDLYFRGSKIIQAQLDYLKENYGLSQASKVVWTGNAIGGIAAYLWMDTVRAMVKDPRQFFTIVDSGIFLDFPTHLIKSYEFTNKLKNLYKLANLDTETPLQVCNSFFSNEPWKCLLIQYNFQFLQGKLLFINSQYDSWAILNILKIKCLEDIPDGGSTLSSCSHSEKDYIEKYRELYQKVMFDIMQITNNNSYWSIACSNHVYASSNKFYDSPSQRIPEVTGMTIKKAIELFVLDGAERITSSDMIGWPSNEPCSK